jgi:hypothetical protein
LAKNGKNWQELAKNGENWQGILKIDSYKK